MWPTLLEMARAPYHYFRKKVLATRYLGGAEAATFLVGTGAEFQGGR
jgi:hypothetical protein